MVPTVKLSTTMEEFSDSKAYVRLIAGAIGSGKSVISLLTLFRWACEQAPNQFGERKTRFLIIRNTDAQLRQTTLKTFLDWFTPDVLTYKISEKTGYLTLPLKDGSAVKSEFLFIALDGPEDIRKALSLECTGIFINESREVNGEVIDALLTRTDRYPSKKDGGATRAGGILDTNYPTIDTYLHEKMENPPRNWSVHRQPPAMVTVEEYVQEYGEEPEEDQTALGGDGTTYCVNPKADNLDNLSRQYYPMACEGKSQDHISVFLLCKYGRSLSGLPVYDKTYLDDFHLAKDRLMVVRSDSYPIIIGIDQGRTPAAVFGQLDVRGRLNVFSEVVGKNMGMETFLATMLRPHINQHYPGLSFVMAPDPASWQRSQVNEISPAEVLKRAGFKLVRPATNKPELRIQAVERFLGRHIDGKAALQVDPGCTELVKGFRYGYRFKLKRDSTMDASPDKNEFSHIHDALQYLCLIAEGGHSGWGMRRFDPEVQVVSAAGWT